MEVREIGLTYKKKVDVSGRNKIISSASAEKVFRTFFDESEELDVFERVYAMYLDRSNKVLSVMLISVGGASQSIVDAKKIITPAILHQASGIILCHNHPSGTLKASSEDIKATNKVSEACKLIDVQLLDHLILTADGYFSMVDNGDKLSITF